MNHREKHLNSEPACGNSHRVRQMHKVASAAAFTGPLPNSTAAQTSGHAWEMRCIVCVWACVRVCVKENFQTQSQGLPKTETMSGWDEDESNGIFHVEWSDGWWKEEVLCLEVPCPLSSAALAYVSHTTGKKTGRRGEGKEHENESVGRNWSTLTSSHLRLLPLRFS